MLSSCFRSAPLRYAATVAVLTLATNLFLALLPPSVSAEEGVQLPNHLYEISRFPNDKFGRLYDETIFWRTDSDILVRTPGPLTGGWRLTLDELSEHLRAKSQKLSLLVLYMAKKASHYPIPNEEVFRELEPIAVYCRSLGYKRVVVAGYMGDIGCFGPYYAYDSDDDYDKAAESKVTMY